LKNAVDSDIFVSLSLRIKIEWDERTNVIFTDEDDVGINRR